MSPPSGEALNICPRPVFWEELDFLGLDKLGWKYPHCKEPLLWACDRKYFYKGELVLETSGGNLCDSHSISFIFNFKILLSLIIINYFQHVN